MQEKLRFNVSIAESVLIAGSAFLYKAYFRFQGRYVGSWDERLKGS